MIEGCRFVRRPGEVDTKKSTGVEHPSTAHDERAQPGTCRLNEDERGGERRRYGPAFDVDPAGKNMVNDHEHVMLMEFCLEMSRECMAFVAILDVPGLVNQEVAQ